MIRSHWRQACGLPPCLTSCCCTVYIMLRRIQVSGFKSLEGFELQFKPGLNVIIGPNGSGKTNIINFIEFLSYLSRDSLLDAVGRSGGAGRIFRRLPSGNLSKHISFSVSGEGEYRDYRRGNRIHWAKYALSGDIELSENNNSIYYRRQRLQFAFDRARSDDSKWQFDMETVGRQHLSDRMS
jgi:predicted ATPase